MNIENKTVQTKCRSRFITTDLALESWDGLSGAEYVEEKNGDLLLTRMRIKSKEASERLGRPLGSYVTVASPMLFSELTDNSFDSFCNVIANELRRMSESLCNKKISPNFGVLIAGLGNAAMTADAVGPETAKRIDATRHLRELDGNIYNLLGCCAISVVAPGVLGQTGIESADILRGAIKYAKPDIVIAVDALAARSCERLGRTVQISDSGICPGSGVGNSRQALDKKTLGIPVIAVGVPTVVNSSTLAWEMLENFGIKEDELSSVLGDALDKGKSFFVCPRESDMITRHASMIISRSVSGAFGSAV